jgi:excinuclease ABC subunit B
VPVAAEEIAGYGYNEDTLKRLEIDMKEAAKKLEFEEAAKIRDKIREIKDKILTAGIKG